MASTCVLRTLATLVAIISASQELTAQSRELRVLQPMRDDVEVGQTMEVQGRAAVPPGEFVWVLVHRIIGFRQVWWPQGEGEIDPANSVWEVSVTFGGPQDVGYDFEIAAIVVNQSQHNRLQEYWLNAMETGDWRPMRMPPTTATPVIRRVKKVSHRE